MPTAYNSLSLSLTLLVSLSYFVLKLVLKLKSKMIINHYEEWWRMKMKREREWREKE